MAEVYNYPSSSEKKSSNNRLIMPKAVAVWLIDNTSLTFRQIASFCNLHHVEVELIANEENYSNIQGCNPIETGQISKEEIKNCENNPSMVPQLILNNLVNKSYKKSSNKTKKSSDKPDAILWLIKYYPKISDKQIIKLIKTTENTVTSIRNKTHWKINSLKPRDPVLLRLCTQEQLDSVEQDIEVE